jgi:hydrogenase maturation protease
MPCSVMVIGIGNGFRADDAAGLEVARRLREEPGIAVKVHGDDAIDLLELWSGADGVVLVDTVSSGEATGTIHRFDATSNPVPLALWGSSSHTIGVAEAIELARTLGSLPQRVLVYGVEGARFAFDRRSVKSPPTRRPRGQPHFNTGTAGGQGRDIATEVGVDWCGRLGVAAPSAGIKRRWTARGHEGATLRLLTRSHRRRWSSTRSCGRARTAAWNG